MHLLRRRRSLLLASSVSVSLAACSDTRPITSPLAPATPSFSLGRPDGGGDPDRGGAVYTLTNAADGNSVIAFRRGGDGRLTRIGAFATGGLGVGGTVDPLTSQFAVVLSPRHDALFAVNAGSNQLSSFRVDERGGLELASVVSSGGQRPVSIAVHERLVYVLNTDDNSLQGFRIEPNERLVPVTKGRRSLAAGASGAAAIRFTPDGRRARCVRAREQSVGGVPCRKQRSPGRAGGERGERQRLVRLRHHAA